MEIKIDLLHQLIRKTVLSKFEDIGTTDGRTTDPKELANALRGIKKWNVSELDSQVVLIKNRYTRIEDLLESIIEDIECTFGTKNTRKVDITLFIHRIFINMGGYLYFRPEILLNTPNKGDMIDKLDTGLKKSIKQAIFDVFPITDVLTDRKNKFAAVPPPVVQPAAVQSSSEVNLNDYSSDEDAEPIVSDNDNDNDSDNENDNDSGSDSENCIPDETEQAPPPVQEYHAPPPPVQEYQAPPPPTHHNDHERVKKIDEHRRHKRKFNIISDE